MAYCTVDNVQALIPLVHWNHDGTGADPSANDVLGYIENISATIDSRLAALYAIPITGATALEIVSSICARLTAIRVWAKAFTAHVGDAAVPKDWSDASKELDRLASGEAILEDAGSLALGSAQAPGAPNMTMRELREDPLQDQVIDPVFTERQVW